jgi:hypothetical protein
MLLSRRPLAPLLVVAAFVAAALLMLGGCDTSVAPRSGRAFFSIRGYLQTELPPGQRQYVRVNDLDRPLGDTARQRLDATVTLENLTDGTVEPMQQRVIVFDSVVTHNFWTDAPIRPATTYRVRVEGADGRVTASTTTTPTDQNLTPDVDFSDCLAGFHLTFPRGSLVYDVHALYRYEGEVYAVDRTSALEFASGAPPRVHLRPEAELRAIIPQPPSLGPSSPIGGPYYSRCPYLDMARVEVAYTLLSGDWAERADSDDDFSPTTALGIDDGIGFFGSVRRDTIAVEVDQTVCIFDMPPRVPEILEQLYATYEYVCSLSVPEARQRLCDDGRTEFCTPAE